MKEGTAAGGEKKEFESTLEKKYKEKENSRFFGGFILPAVFPGVPSPDELYYSFLFARAMICKYHTEWGIFIWAAINSSLPTNHEELCHR